eukprot:NODE_563_length_1806_cov_55.011912_g554_i0.p1 GENE.NODE_563_length_1806_cov_55.011912_g554_i0~~NODE_563_length_1806_cov_55.011912_g554_i0.p1  ORF type:complete len:492 (-),score=105.63 NODE_563_length_1806_cov_55.011912_g554_i0:227-1702(-)
MPPGLPTLPKRPSTATPTTGAAASRGNAAGSRPGSAVGSRPATAAAGRPPAGGRGRKPLIQPGFTDDQLDTLKRKELLRVKVREDQQRKVMSELDRAWEDKYQNLQAELEDKQRINAELRERIRDLQNQNVAQSHKVCAMQSEMEILNHTIQELNNQMEVQKATARMELEETRTQVKQVDVLKQQCLELRDEVDVLLAKYRSVVNYDLHEDSPAPVPTPQLKSHMKAVKAAVEEFTKRAEEALKEIEANAGDKSKLQEDGKLQLTLSRCHQFLVEIRGMQQYLYTCQQTASAARLQPYVQLLHLGYSMHTNIPQLVKDQLWEMNKEQLIVVLDAISFTQGVVPNIMADLTPRYRVSGGQGGPTLQGKAPPPTASEQQERAGVPPPLNFATREIKIEQRRPSPTHSAAAHAAAAAAAAADARNRREPNDAADDNTTADADAATHAELLLQVPTDGTRPASAPAAPAQLQPQPQTQGSTSVVDSVEEVRLSSL